MSRPPFNARLERQIREYFGAGNPLPENMAAFLAGISSTYDAFDFPAQPATGHHGGAAASANSLAEHGSYGEHGSHENHRTAAHPHPAPYSVAEAESTEHNDTPTAEHLRTLIAEFRNSERQFAEREARFRLIAESASDLLVSYNAEGMCNYISPSCEQLLGFSQNELVGQSVFDFLHQGDAQMMRRAIAAAARSNEPFIVTPRVRTRSGQYRWMETTIRVNRDPDTRKVIEYHTIARDVTERLAAEASLRRASLRMSTLVENLEAGVLVEDENRRIAVVNASFCRLFNIPVPPAALVGYDCRNAAEESKHFFADQPTFVRRINELLEHRETCVGEELAMADGRTLERDYVPIFLDGEYSGHLWHYRDITARKRDEEAVRQLNDSLRATNELLRVERDREKEHVRALQELNDMKSEFVSSVSHELRTPLASIIGFAQTVLIDPDLDSDSIHEFIGIVHEEGKRLAKLIDDLLDIARIESGRSSIDRRDSDMVPLLTRTVQTVTQQASAKNIALITEFQEPSIQGRFDPDRMAQVLINLLGNAIKFTPPGGRVTIGATCDPHTITLTVTDSGMGIPEADLPRIFDKFFRVHRPGLEIRGTGLGLAIVNQLVQLHEGTIDVQSTSGVGTTFTVRIPRHERDVEQSRG